MSKLQCYNTNIRGKTFLIEVRIKVTFHFHFYRPGSSSWLNTFFYHITFRSDPDPTKIRIRPIPDSQPYNLFRKKTSMHDCMISVLKLPNFCTFSHDISQRQVTRKWELFCRIWDRIMHETTWKYFNFFPSLSRF